MKQARTTLFLIALACALVGCNKLEPNGFDDPQPGDVLADLDDATDDADLVDTEVADTTDADQDEDTVEDATEDMDTGPSLDCPRECAGVAPVIEECFGDIIGLGPALDAAGQYRPHPFASAVSATPDQIDLLREAADRARALAPSAKIVTDEIEGVVIVEGAGFQDVAQELSAQSGLVPLNVAATPSGRSAVVLPRVIVSLEESGVDIGDLLGSLGATRSRSLGWGHNLIMVTLDDATSNAFDVADALADDPRIRWAEPDLLRQYETHSDPLLADQWHLDSRSHDVARPSADIMATEAWEITRGSSDVVIGIFDDGVDFEHPDLADHIVPGINLPDNLQAAISDGCCSHGTAVAGISAAIGDNDRGVSGVCPQCSIMPIFDPINTLSDSRIANQIVNAVDQGADVINNSWGPLDGDPRIVDEPGRADDLGQVLLDAFDYAETTGRNGKGTVLLWAAGNGNEPVDSDPFANHPKTLAIAAYTDQTRKSWYSDFGDAIDVAAPSSGGFLRGTVTTIPNNITYGKSVEGDLGERYTYGFGGTSSASPTVSGMVGLIISANPDLTAAQIRQLVRDSADRIDPLNGDYDENGHSPYYGYGAINAYRAVLMAQAMGPGCDTNRVEVCNGVDDNCDGTVDEGCAPAGTCEPCLLSGQCASGICAGTPGDTGEHCLDPCGAGDSCPTDFTCTNGLCVPDSQRCAPCEATEVCNNVDDNCNGEVDEGACEPAPAGQCFADAQCQGEGSSGEVICASKSCQTKCVLTGDCAGDECVDATNRYGQVDGTRICSSGAGALCVNFVCEGKGDAIDRENFFKCMDKADGECGAAIACAIPFL